MYYKLIRQQDRDFDSINKKLANEKLLGDEGAQKKLRGAAFFIYMF